MNNQNTIKYEKRYILQTYKRYNLVAVKAKDKYVWDNKGKRYLDFFSGLSVCNLGHCNTRVVRAIKKQINQILHISNLYYTTPQVILAKELIKRTFPGKVFFSNSGAESIECALKAARKWGSTKTKNNLRRYEFIVFKNSFHGRTFGALSATCQERFHKGFEPLLPGFRYAEFNDISSLEKVITPETIAILVEPVQGEGGVIPAKKDFIEGISRICNQNNILFIVDEIQSGLGRTGRFFAYEHFGVKPDIVALSKSLGGGLPLGATIIREDIADVFSYGDHGSTFGGNPVICSAAIEVINQITPKLLNNVRFLGEVFLKELKDLMMRYPFIKDARGMGLMLALELNIPGRDIVEYCQQHGLLINCTHDTILRFLPPLIININDIKYCIKILEDAFKWIKSER